jgi:N-acetylmuramoyl-L-alanine amidase
VKIAPPVLALVVSLSLADVGRAQSALTLSAEDREAITRVAEAEAGNQGDSGVAAVVQTILNRLAAGTWGSSVEQVVDAPHQFEPVARAGGDWRRLPAPSDTQRAQVNTILTLIADGRMPDFIGGALYFQNPKIVAARVAAGTIPADRLNFGGRVPVATIGDHAFYSYGLAGGVRTSPPSAGPIFIPKPVVETPAAAAPAPEPSAGVATSSPPDRAMFILSDGRLAEDPLPQPQGR